jgi:hypothetical protein
MGLFSFLFGKNAGTDLADLIAKGAFLVDVLTPGEFASGHVSGSVNIPLDRVRSEINKFKGKEHIIVFCRSGNRSRMAKGMLDAAGIKNVVNGGSWTRVKKFIG